ncbi:MAG: hypothetical protein HY652_02620 [Acidobacteria bacterium]|nr:hypothetical protein [Acidobacteriota bacterium]
MYYFQVVVQFLIFVCAVFSAYFAIQLYLLVKGGELSNSWSLISAALSLFALTWFLEFGKSLDLIRLGDWVFPLSHLLFVVLVLLSLIWFKRILS